MHNIKSRKQTHYNPRRFMKNNIMNFQQSFQKSNLKSLKEFLAYKYEYFNTVCKIYIHIKYSIKMKMNLVWM